MTCDGIVQSIAEDPSMLKISKNLNSQFEDKNLKDLALTMTSSINPLTSSMQIGN